MRIDKIKQNEKDICGQVVDLGGSELGEFFPYKGRHERAELFHYYYDMIPDDKKYEMFRDLWDSVDNMQYLLKPKILRDVFKHRSNCRNDITRRVLRDFADCDGMLTVYRGTYKGARKGWSWTLNRDVGHWFASRLESEKAVYYALVQGLQSAGAKGKVLKGKVHIDDVMDYFRHESTVIVNPKKVVSVCTEEADEVAVARQRAEIKESHSKRLNTSEANFQYSTISKISGSE